MNSCKPLGIGILCALFFLSTAGCGNYKQGYQDGKEKGYRSGLHDGYWRGTQTYIRGNLPNVGAIAVVFATGLTIIACVGVSSIILLGVAPCFFGLVEELEYKIEKQRTEKKIRLEQRLLLEEQAAEDNLILQDRQTQVEVTAEMMTRKAFESVSNEALKIDLEFLRDKACLFDHQRTCNEIFRRFMWRKTILTRMSKNRAIPAHARLKMIRHQRQAITSQAE